MRGLKPVGVFAAVIAIMTAGGAQAQMVDNYASDIRFGAIAVAAGQPLIYAATNYTTAREASSAARRACQKKGRAGCQTVVGFEKGCGALAVASDGKWFTTKAEYRQDARDAALAKCKDSGADGCRVEVSPCADDPE